MYWEPHADHTPYPEMVSWFQSIIGREARKQILEQAKRLPDRVYACVGGGSNALGIFNGFLNDPVELVGAEAAGRGLHTGEHAARLASSRWQSRGGPGVQNLFFAK